MIQNQIGACVPEYEYANKALGSVRVGNDLIAQATERLLKIKDKLLGESPVDINKYPVLNVDCNGIVGEITRCSDDNNVRIRQLLEVIIELEKL